MLHYNRWRRHGSPEPEGIRVVHAGTAEERFWTKVDVRGPDECWPWMAATFKGYGRFYPEPGVQVTAHRYAYELEVGPVPEGHTLHHECRLRACCNWRHVIPMAPSKHGRLHRLEVVG